MTAVLLLLAALLLAPPALADSVEDSESEAPAGLPDEIASCIERSRAEPDSARAARLTRRDRRGEQTVTVVRLFGRRADGGLRELLVRFLAPEDMRGSALLVREGRTAEGLTAEHEIYFATPELGAPTRLRGGGRGAPLIGTDFTYEEFAYLEGFVGPGIWTRRPDDRVSERAVFVMERRPLESDYARIVSHIDQESCLPLRVWFYETEHYIRKEFSIDATSIRKVGSTWVPQSALMRDRAKKTTTQLSVDRAAQDPLPAEFFSVEALVPDPAGPPDPDDS